MSAETTFLDMKTSLNKHWTELADVLATDFGGSHPVPWAAVADPSCAGGWRSFYAILRDLKSADLRNDTAARLRALTPLGNGEALPPHVFEWLTRSAVVDSFDSISLVLAYCANVLTPVYSNTDQPGLALRWIRRIASRALRAKAPVQGLQEELAVVDGDAQTRGFVLVPPIVASLEIARLMREGRLGCGARVLRS